MSNHYHLFLQTLEPNLVAGMSWLQNTLTRRHNVRQRKWGRVFGDRYKAVLVEGEQRYHYQTLMDYIHLNPVRARIVSPVAKQSVLDYPWSSAANAGQPLRRLDRRKAQARISSELCFYLEQAEQAET